MFYAFRVNSALALLGVRPALVAKTYRDAMHEQGKAAGNSPQEVAIYIASQLPLIHRADLRQDLIESWISTGKVDHKKLEMRDALGSLALWDLMMLP
jgi:hypothetical protein